MAFMNILIRFLPPAAALLVLAGAAAAQAVAVPDSIAQRAAACVACHGKEGRATSEGYFPRIAGKPEAYLYIQLLNFRDGKRQYPAMTHMVAHLSDGYLREMSAYFAAQHPPYPAPGYRSRPRRRRCPPTSRPRRSRRRCHPGCRGRRPGPR